MALQTVKVRFSGKTGALDIKTQGFFGDACTEVTKTVTGDLGANVLSETKTPEASLEPPAQRQENEQEVLA